MKLLIDYHHDFINLNEVLSDINREAKRALQFYPNHEDFYKEAIDLLDVHQKKAMRLQDSLYINGNTIYSSLDLEMDIIENVNSIIYYLNDLHMTMKKVDANELDCIKVLEKFDENQYLREASRVLKKIII